MSGVDRSSNVKQHEDDTQFALHDKVSGAPICQPLKTLEDVLSWQRGYNPAARGSVALYTPDNWSAGWKSRPRTVVCHDMDGGYLQDRFLQGSDESDAYRFYHWQYVDMFIYFSHYFVTLPPPSWINMAHKHGTMMLGTLITEWDEGNARCEAFLKDRDSYEALADKLVELAEYYGFDGWLVNIENVIEESKVPRLVGFVEYLTKEMHRSQPHSIVLWYDSVIKTGKLIWQNELNDLNRCFFDVSDGLFVNYTWTPDHLRRSVELAEQCQRPYDVYVGVDVFGRGCPGGGGFNTKEAVDAAKEMSRALFAQGWVYERQDKATFTDRENRFWSLLDPYCCRHSYHGLPFASHFCQGQGDRFYRNGKVLADKAWTNLSLQSMQPTFTQAQFGESEPPAKPLIQIWRKDAYHGGSCLKLSASKPCNFRLFSVDISTSETLLVSYTLKEVVEQPSTRFSLRLNLSSPAGPSTLILGEDGSKPVEGSQSLGQPVDDEDKPSAVVRVPSLTAQEAEQLCGRYSLPGDVGWTTRYYTLDQSDQDRVEEISFHMWMGETGGSSAECLLGQVQITSLSDLDEIPLLSNLTVMENPSSSSSSSSSSIQLQWCFPEKFADHFLVYSRQEEPDHHTLVGSTHASCYEIQSAPTGTVHYTVQPILRTGFARPLKACKSVTRTGVN